jgi:hypothetical protein
LRQLCASGAEQLRIASELDSAARAQRLLAQEVQHGIEALLASWERHIKMSREEAEASPASLAQRGDVRRRRRWRILGAGLAAPEAEAGTGTAAAGQMAGSVNLFHPPISRSPYVGSGGESEEDSVIGVEPKPVLRVVTPDAEVAACVLGPLDLTVAGHRILKWNSLKARTVFQYLVIQVGRPVRREVLMELMWPDHSVDSARNNLNAALYSLRNTLDQHGRRIQYILYWMDATCRIPN